jgi:hypothetical protein
MRTRLAVVAIALAATGVMGMSGSAQAAPLIWPVIFDNGPAVGGGSEATEWIQANDFTLVTDSVITAITFLTIEFTDPPDVYAGSVYIAIYNHDTATDALDSSGLIFETVLNPTRTFFVPTTTPGQDMFRYHAIVPAFDLELAAGTYWLALHNGPMSNTARADWYWARTFDDPSGRGALADRAPFDGAWADTGYEHAFLLEDHVHRPVPAPPGLVLLTIGFVGLCLRRGRRPPGLGESLCLVRLGRQRFLQIRPGESQWRRPR